MSTWDYTLKFQFKLKKDQLTIVKPTEEAIIKLYPGIDTDFNYGLIICILEYLSEIKGLLISSPMAPIQIYSESGEHYSLGEILLEAEKNYTERLHNQY